MDGSRWTKLAAAGLLTAAVGCASTTPAKPPPADPVVPSWPGGTTGSAGGGLDRKSVV